MIFEFLMTDGRGGAKNGLLDRSGTSLAVLGAATVLVGVAILVLQSGRNSEDEAEDELESSWMGMLRYIWEGDPYPEEVRTKVTELKRIRSQLRDAENVLKKLESTHDEAASAHSGSDASNGKKLTLKQWKDEWSMVSSSSNVLTHLSPTGNLRKDISQVSHHLDRWASQIDGIQTLKNGNDTVQIKYVLFLKKHKKKLSTKVVVLMEKADYLIKAFLQLEKQT